MLPILASRGYRRYRATAAHLSRENDTSNAKAALYLLLLLIPYFLLLLKLPKPIAAIFLLYLTCINIVTAVMFYKDKKAAFRREWRVSERGLHCLELLDGWPASYILQRYLKHKTRKEKYQNKFTRIVLYHQIAVS